MNKLQWAEKHIQNGSRVDDVHDEYSVGYVAWCLLLEAVDANQTLSEELRRLVVPLGLSHIMSEGFQHRDFDRYYFAWVKWLQYVKIRSHFHELPSIAEPVFKPRGPQREARKKRKAMAFHQRAFLESLQTSEGGQP